MANQVEIGSDISISPKLIFDSSKFKKINGLFLSRGRDCIQYIINLEKFNDNDKILLPSYICPSVVHQFEKNNIRVSFYKINKKLEVDISDLIKKLEKQVKCLFVVNFFGFEQPNLSIIEKICKEKQISVVIDNVQSPLSKKSFHGDYSFNSLRKSLPVPDGAILKIKKNRNINLKVHSIFHGYFRFLFLTLKNTTYLKSLWYPLLKYYEKNLVNKGPFPSYGSKISSYLTKSINFKEVVKTRRRNYIYLRDKISSLDIDFLYKDLPNRVCPLSLPILVNKRDKVRNSLIVKKIFPPIHWDISSILHESDFPMSFEISKRILSLPIDQRYSLNDMNKIATELSYAIGN